MSKPNKFIRVWSDNYSGTLFTLDGYNELRLQMSTGDFHTHQTMVCIGNFDHENAVTAWDLTELERQG